MSENKIEYQVFTYPFIFRLIFRYGNFIVTPVLLVYSVPLLTFLSEKIIIAFPLLVNIFILYFLNKNYINLYKIMPYKIEVDDDKITCSDFFLSRRQIVINYESIISLSGGIFDNKLSGIMKVCDEKNDVCIGFSQRLNNSSKLATILLSKVDRPLYDKVLQRIVDGKKKVKK